MLYKRGIIKETLLNGKKWYHQRFDGCPYLMHLIGEAELTQEERKMGCHFTVHYSFYKKNVCDWYILLDDINRVSKLILAKNDSKLGEKLRKSWKKDQDLFYKKCLEIKDLEQLSDDELITLHDNFVKISINKNSSSSIIDGFALGTDNLIADKIKALNVDMKFTKLFTILTAPVKLSFVNEAQLSLLNTALKIKKNSKNKRKYLEEHQNDYFWLRNNYVDSYIISLEEIETEIKQIDFDIEKEIKFIENLPKQNKDKKEKLIKDLSISGQLLTLLKISEEFTDWQDERKRSTLWNAHYFTLILKEISKRTNISLNDLKYMLPMEVSNVFRVKQIDPKRSKFCVVYVGNDSCEVISSNDAEKIKDEVIGNEINDKIDDFRGLTASMGKVKGKVKVVKSVKEINKVSKNDILVAVMTRPDYLPAMKKAAAIVTDEGGITSHAAIVSRELGVPCIIGTKIATKVLKDGMEVEVNANHGWVKIK